MNELTARLRRREGREYATAIGGLALFAASLLATLRMETEWAAFPVWLLVAVPCAILLGLARRGDAPGPENPSAPGPGERVSVAPWRIAFALAGLVLLGLTLIQTTIVLGDDEAGSATLTWVLAVVGFLAAGLAGRTDSRGATFLACIALGGALIAFADWTSDGLGITGIRDLLLAEGIAFLVAARLTRAGAPRHSHLLVAVAAAALILGAVAGAVKVIDPFAFLLGGIDSGAEIGDDGWELVMIAVSLGALAYAARESARGPGYVGIAGLIAFVSIVGEGSLSGWPIVLAVVAIAGIAYGLTPLREQASPPR